VRPNGPRHLLLDARFPILTPKKPKDKVLVSKLLPDIKCWWNPAEGATGKLMYDMDKPIAT